MVFQIARASPISEERILEAVVDKLCQLDVDIKQPKAHRKCDTFSSLSRIQQMTDYIRELTLKTPSHSESKMGLLFDLLLGYLKDRMATADHDFVTLMLSIFERKLLPLHKVNFMQYLPLFVMSHGNDQARIFTEKLLSLLIHKIFNPQRKPEHLSVRQHAWNYLASLLARENGIIKTTTVLKCLQIVIAKQEDDPEETLKEDRADSISSSSS